MKTPSLVRIVRGRARLFVSLAIGILVAAGLTVFSDWRPATRMLVAWDISLGLYLILAAHLMAGSDADRRVLHLQRRAARPDGQHRRQRDLTDAISER